ncbi:MAG: AMP-binding protein [Bryobacteraceae bacterium]
MSLLLPFRALHARRKTERSCRWTPAELKERQREGVAAIRGWAYHNSPFYRRFHRGLEGRPLNDLPVLTKAELMDGFDELVTDRMVRLQDVEEHLSVPSSGRLYRDRYVALATSGSTGRRGVFLFDQHEWVTALTSISRPMMWAGLRPSPFRRVRTAMVASTSPSHYSARVGQSLATRVMPTLRLDASLPLEFMVRRLNVWRPEVLMAYPSVLRPLAEEQIGGRLRIPLRIVAASAEVLPPETRQLVRQAWQVGVWDTYGATEYAPIAAECDYGRKHLFEGGAVIEIVDERGRPVPPGITGDRVLLTVFNRRTQPLIRYEITDRIRLSGRECECGRPFRVVEQIEGRVEETLYFDGRHGKVPLHPNAFHAVLEGVRCTGWQVVQEDEGLIVKLTGVRETAVCETVQEAMGRMLADLGAQVENIWVRLVPELQRGASGKAPLIASRVGQELRTAG